MANQVDSLDEQILAALQENGRLTMKSLAEHVGLSSPAMIERVRRLEERGVISGYRAVVAPAALGATDQRVDRGHGRPARSGRVQSPGCRSNRRWPRCIAPPAMRPIW